MTGLGRVRRAEALAFIAVVLGLAMWRFGATVADPDLWGHVRFGIDKIEAGAYLSTDSYSYLTEGSTWFNHEWLGEVVMGGLYLWFGSAGLVVAKAILAGTVVVLLTRRLVDDGADPVRATILMALGIVLLTPTFGTFRPQVFTTLLFTVTLFVIVSFQRGSARLIWSLPPLFAVWVNLHGGVLSGIVVLWVWALAYLFFGEKGRKWQAATVAALCSVALLLNPNGFDHVRFLIETTTVSRPDIVEWEAVDLFGPLGIVYLLTVSIVVVALVAARRKLDLPLVAPLLGLLVAPLLAGRHLQLFVPGVVVLGSASLVVILGKGRDGETAARDASRAALTAFLAVALVSSGFAVGRVALASSCLALDSTQFEFPSRGVAALGALQPVGNAVVPFNWGQYVIWHLGPEVQVSGDGRRETIYTEEVHQANLDFANGVGDWDRILDMAPTDYVIQRTGTPGAELMGSEPGWSLSYEDRITSIFLPDGSSQVLTGDESIPVDGDGLCFPAEA
jgi:hypothetical protein